MASANAPYATTYNEPKYEVRRQAEQAPWDKEQAAWKKSKTCANGGPNAGARRDLMAPEPEVVIPPPCSNGTSAQSAPFGTEENKPDERLMPSPEAIASANRAPWDREESPYFSKVFLSSATPHPTYLHTTRWRT